MLFEPSNRLNTLVTELMEQGGAGIATRAMTLVALPPAGGTPKGASHHGDWLMYPASISKLFIMALVEAGIADRSFAADTDDRRALDDMIRVSSNDATGYLIDRLSGAPNGPASWDGFDEFARRRATIDDRLQAWGWRELERCRLRQKTYGDGPFGAEAIYIKWAGRNQLTTDAVARFLIELDAGRLAGSAAMLARMERNRAATNQSEGFLGAGLSSTTRIWSKAGWTSGARHDCAIIAWPDGRRAVVVVFLEGAEAAGNASLLPALARALEERMPLCGAC